MSTSVWTEPSDLSTAAGRALSSAARFWFAVAVVGQWIFVLYVVAFYGGTAVQGNLEAWNKVLPNGYTPGNPIANAAVATHLLLAVVIMAGGPLQLIPSVRRVAPRFHRWNGRVYMVSVSLTAIVGLYMVWSHSSAVRLIQHLGISLDAILIVAFSILAVRHAIARDLATHRRWALRLFMVVNAGWFFRIGLMEWVFLNRGPIGFDPDTFTGPFLNFLSFADYLLPLAVLEVYLRMRDSGSAAGRFALAALLIVLTLGMGLGIFGATVAMWLPRM
jgi:hypothetical protein